MTALLTENLPLLASAPNGIKKLRELILELAVRGKLVPQDPNDEPASELLKQIADEKGRRVAEGKIRKQKPLAEVSDDEKPFELPAGWMWTRLGDICLTQTGATPSKSQSELFGSDVPFIKPGDIYPDQVDYSGEGLSSLGVSQSGRIAQAGSLLMVCIGTIGKCNLIERDCSFNQQINSATLYKGIPQYLRVAARSAYFQGKAWSESSSTTIAILNKGKWEAIPLPLPGLNEQHRIVAKVDELMALCDRLEAQQADAESAHAQLVQALLDSLTQASNAFDFTTNWQRLAEHFHTLFTTESSIDALKQTLLQLAVMGKLVPQDPNDEPASELLKRIAEEKTRLVAEGKIKTPKPLTDIAEDEKTFELPAGWEWCQLGQISSDIQYGFTASANHQMAEPLFLRITDIQNDSVNWESVPGCDISPAEISGYELEDGDIVIARTGGTIGKSYLVKDLTRSAVFASYLIRVGRLDSTCPDFTKIFLGSPFYWKQLYANSMGTGQPNVNGTALKGLLFPLAPMTEQHRIVAKVEQLMALCDQLKNRLTQARQLNEQLASTLVEQAVA